MNDYREFLNKIESSEKKKKKHELEDDFSKIEYGVLDISDMSTHTVVHGFKKYNELYNYFRSDYKTIMHRTNEQFEKEVEYLVKQILFVPFEERNDLIIEHFGKLSEFRNFKAFLSIIRYVIGFDRIEDDAQRTEFQLISATNRLSLLAENQEEWRGINCLTYVKNQLEGENK